MDQRQFFVRDVLTVVFKRIKLILFLPILIFAVVFVGNYLWPPTYESMAKVRLVRGREVSQTDPTVTSTGQDMTMISLTVEDLNSEIELVHSRDLLEQVVRDMKLDEDPDFPYGSGPLRAPFLATRAFVATLLDVLQIKKKPDKVELAMQQLNDALIVEPVRDSYVLEIRCRLGAPDLAQGVLENVVSAFKARHIEVFRTPESSGFFEQKKRQTREALEMAEKEMLEVRQKQDVGLVETEIELLNEEYTKNERLLKQLEELARVIEGQDLETKYVSLLAIETEQTVVREMQLRLYELILERNRVKQSLAANHPQVQSLNGQVSEALADLRTAIDSIRQATTTKQEATKARLNELNAIKKEFDAKQREIDILAASYELYSQKYEESVISEELAEKNISSIREMSKATLPTNPVRPNRLMNLILAIIGGFVLALGLAFFFEYLDHGLKTPEDVEHYVKVTPLASFFNPPGQPLDGREAERLSIMLDTITSKAGESQLYEVTSAVSREGSPQVAAALAHAFASDAENRTLLVDFAGEIPEAKRAQHGLIDILLDQTPLDAALSGGENLVVLGRGAHGEYPAHLWGSDRMKQLVEALRGRFKYIIFHAGPVLQAHDAVKLARYADGVLLAIKADATRREVVGRAVQMLKDANAAVLGAVLTERTQTIPRAVYRRFLRA